MAILLMTRKTVTVQATYEIQYMMELWKDKIICLLHCNTLVWVLLVFTMEMSRVLIPLPPTIKLKKEKKALGLGTY